MYNPDDDPSKSQVFTYDEMYELIAANKHMMSHAHRLMDANQRQCSQLARTRELLLAIDKVIGTPAEDPQIIKELIKQHLTGIDATLRSKEC